MSDGLRVAFIHPDLGIGGAERLVVDAAVELQRAGHEVTVFTAHRDPSRCLPAARDGTLDVRVHGAWLPMGVFGRLLAPCAILRMAWLAVVIASRRGRFDVVFCDLVAHVLPLLRRLTRARLVFYCHYPDRFVAPAGGAAYRWYRKPIDALERVGLRAADLVLVNSRFTAAEFVRAFPRFRDDPPHVLHPGVARADASSDEAGGSAAAATEPFLLSVNRFEAKKNVGLAIDALALLDTLTDVPVRLVVAGGYDERLADSRDTLADLRRRAAEQGVGDRVEFVLSPEDGRLEELVAACLCVVYTPQNEHFGIVPVEAMAAGRPVVAVRSGGPLETIEDGVTGLLCEPTPAAFAEAIAGLVTDGKRAERMGRAGRARAREHFSRSAFGGRLDAVLRDTVSRGKEPA